jgi:monovalent cation:H+ antiporter-2, CPA2 family
VPDTRYLVDVLQLLLAAVICVPLFQRMRLGPVVGYLFAGTLIGPSVLGLVDEVDAVRSLAELGIVFLLFHIGLEFTVEKLRALGGAKFSLGVTQVAVTAGLAGAITFALGFGSVAAVIVGGAVAMSSTMIVLPLLASQGRLATEFGQAALAVLLVQDLAMAPLLVLIETLRGNAAATGSELGLALSLAAAKAVIAVTIIVVAGRFVLTPLFRVVAETKSSELFVATALLVAIGTSWLTEHVGLSLAFGAFLAGLLLAETEFRHQVAADIEPFRGILVGLFFMTVGMSVDLAEAARHPVLVVALAVALFAGKAAVITPLAMVFGHGRWDALRLGLTLGQGGEFAFILLGLAAASGLLPAQHSHVLLAAVGITLLTMPLVARFEEWLDRRIDDRHLPADASLAHARLDAEDHVVVIGQSEVGRIVTRMLKAYDLPYVSLDQSVAVVRRLRTEGEPIYFGDATDPEVLKGVRAERARAIIVACDDPGTTEFVVAMCRHNFPDQRLIVRAATEQAMIGLRKLGVTVAVQESTEIGLRLAGAVLDKRAE